MSIRLRTATSADALTLLEIQREASLAAFPHIFPPGRYPFPSEEVVHRWQEQLAAPDVRVLIAERNDHPVGTAAYDPGRFDQLWVVPSEWGSGLSQVLYDEVVRELTQLGVRVCCLWVLAENQRARTFYERRGWRPDGRTMTTPYPPKPQLVGYSLELSDLPEKSQKKARHRVG